MLSPISTISKRSNTVKLYSLSKILIQVLLFSLAYFYTAQNAYSQMQTGLSMHGELKYKENFQHFSYTNPGAPKGGKLRNAYVGSFNSLNPLISKGVPIFAIRTYVFESLMARSYDEPFSLYGLLAERVEVPKDRSWIIFHLNKKAAFSDGKPVTVDDVIFSHALLRDKGRPNHRTFYSKVQSVEKLGSHAVKFSFKGSDQEIPLIMGLMPVLPKHFFSRETFEKTTLKAPLGSGPYKVAQITPGKKVLFKKNPDYWAKDLPISRGRFNFDEVQIDYYRDHNTLFEAFKKGLYHVRYEDDPSKWALSYNFDAIKKKDVIKKTVPLALPSGMDALVFNTRRELFSDIRVRKALTYVFDFEWINKSLFHGLYSRTQSFFDRSVLSSHKTPADEYESKILAPYKELVDKKILSGSYKLPVGDTNGRNRTNRRKALKLLSDAGYVLKKGKLIHAKTQKPFTFEILIATRSQERLILTYARALKTIGITVNLRQVDPAQYQARKRTFDFDMLQNYWSGSLSPGNEQIFRWSTKAADTEGSYNFPGVKNEAVDNIIQAMLSAKSYKNFASSVRALDRVLLSGHYMIPLYHPQGQWVAMWNKIKCPKTSSIYGLRIDTCWMEE